VPRARMLINLNQVLGGTDSATSASGVGSSTSMAFEYGQLGITRLEIRRWTLNFEILVPRGSQKFPQLQSDVDRERSSSVDARFYRGIKVKILLSAKGSPEKSDTRYAN